MVVCYAFNIFYAIYYLQYIKLYVILLYKRSMHKREKLMAKTNIHQIARSWEAHCVDFKDNMANGKVTLWSACNGFNYIHLCCFQVNPAFPLEIQPSMSLIDAVNVIWNGLLGAIDTTVIVSEQRSINIDSLKGV